VAKKATKKAAKKPSAKTAVVTGGASPPIPVPPPPAMGDVLTKRAALDSIANHFNAENHMVMVRADEAPNPYLLRRPTGIMEMDIQLGGGFPAGGLCFVSGPDNCLAENSFIQFETRYADGKRSNHKGGTIETLYKRFQAEKERLFFAPSVDDDHSVFQNRILDVVCTGTQECFAVITKSNRILTATAQHRLMTPSGYTEVQHLRKGSVVYMHECTTRKKCKSTKRARRAEVCVKHHPALTPQKRRVRSSRSDWEKEYVRCRLYKSRAVVEAALNGLSYDSYISRLNKGELAGLKTLTPEQCVHHLDENPANDSLDNLLVVTRGEHMMEHWEGRKPDLSFVATEDIVKEIIPAGKRVTYDLKMAAPFRNYVADKFVVHNSGKTWLLLRTIAMQQLIHQNNFTGALAITEGGFPYDQAMKVGCRIAVPDQMILQWQQIRTDRGFPPYRPEDIAYFKQQVGDLRVIRGSHGEEILTVLLEVVRSHACSLVGVDSIQGLQPSADAGKELLDNDKMAAHATMIGRFFKKYIPLTTGLGGVNETTLLFTQQVRSNKAKSEASANIQKYLKDWAVGGAYSTKHYKLIDLVLHEGARDKKEGEYVSKMVHWETEKGKAGTHDNLVGSIKYHYSLEPGVDFTGTVVDSALQRGLLRKVGSKYMLIRPETGEVLDDYTTPSLKAFKRSMELDFDFEMGVRRELLAAAGVSCLYRQEFLSM